MAKNDDANASSYYSLMKKRDLGARLASASANGRELVFVDLHLMASPLWGHSHEASNANDSNMVICCARIAPSSHRAHERAAHLHSDRDAHREYHIHDFSPAACHHTVQELHNVFDGLLGDGDHLAGGLAACHDLLREIAAANENDVTAPGNDKGKESM